MSVNVLFWNWYFLGVKSISSHTPKQDLGTSYGLFSKFAPSNPTLFKWVPPPNPHPGRKRSGIIDYISLDNDFQYLAYSHIAPLLSLLIYTKPLGKNG